MQHLGMSAKPKVVDLTRKAGTAETLTETKIHCSMADKVRTLSSGWIDNSVLPITWTIYNF